MRRPPIRADPPAGSISTLMWCTDAMPCDMPVGENVEDMGARMLGTPPPPNGTRFTVIDFPPGCPPSMHRTETIDYVIVLSGEIDMDMDDSTVKLKAGDVDIQRGTNHAWANRGTSDGADCRRAGRRQAAWHRPRHHRVRRRELDNPPRRHLHSSHEAV